MEIPKYAVWSGRAKILEQGWTDDFKLKLNGINKEVEKYGAALSPWKRRKSAQAIQKLIDDFEKAWVNAYRLAPTPPPLVELRAAAQDQAPAALTNRRYDFVSCIAYKVGTGSFDQNIWVEQHVNGALWYGGHLVQYDGQMQDEADRALRCSRMKAAIEVAYTSYTSAYSSDPDDGKTLKIFMAPEFFFRGRGGAYDISFVSAILNELRGLTKDTKFKDWLFVPGTVVTATFAGNVYLVCNNCGQSVLWGDAKGFNNAGFTYEGTDAHGKQIFACPGPPPYSGSVREPCPPGSVKEIPEKAIIDNMALVQKGGEDSEQNSRYVQKETVSAIDFKRAVTRWNFSKGVITYGPKYTNVARFDDDWSKLSGRKIEVMGHNVTALPSPGARDVSIPYFDQRTSDTRDETKSGGSLFTIDGIKFGLEVCVDHLNSRLPPSAGVQIQLVPSAGAHLARFVCVPGGIAFNVDGQGRGKCDVRVNASGQDPQHSGSPDQSSGGVIDGDGQGGAEIVMYEPYPIAWA